MKQKKHLLPVLALIPALALGITATCAISTAAKEAGPVFMRFSGNAGMLKSQTSFYSDSNGTQGSYKMLTTEDGTKALQLYYAQNNTFSAYRAMPKFTKANVLTEKTPYVRVVYMTPERPAYDIVLTNNKNGDTAVLVPDTSVSQGEWAISAPVDISKCTLLDRLKSGAHSTLQFRCIQEDAEIYIKEIAFFASPEQAYAYYGDSAEEMQIPYRSMDFQTNGNVTFLNSDIFGVHSLNEETGVLDITYAEKTNFGDTAYMAKIRFAAGSGYSSDYNWVRICYRATNPTDTDTVNMVLQNDKVGKETVTFSDIKTGPEFVLSEAKKIPTDMANRFAGSGAYSSPFHNTPYFSTQETGGKYEIKTVYFFRSEEEANAFTLDNGNVKLTVMGNNIADYQIIIPEAATENIVTAAAEIQAQIKALTGVILPIEKDSAEVRNCEILLGNTNRPETASLTKKLDSRIACLAAPVGEKYVIVSALSRSIGDITDMVLRSFFAAGKAKVPNEIAIDEACTVKSNDTRLTLMHWAQPENVENPVVYTDSFAEDEGYWTEESANSNWHFENGAYISDAADLALSYIHVYEQNVEMQADFTLCNTEADTRFGLLFRYTAEHAYVRAGYDFGKGAWYIESREGEDFDIIRTYGTEVALKENTVYRLKALIHGDSIKLEVNGETVAEENKLSQMTPGRVGIYAIHGESLVDNAEITFLSGQGKILQNVVHTKLPDDTYREGGTVFEMQDGSLVYQHISGTSFASNDKGASWERLKDHALGETDGYPNMLRLQNGDFLKIMNDGKQVYAMTSSDDGKTWTKGGNLAQAIYQNSQAKAGNMNDKLTQMSDGRIFYGQNYEAPSSAPVDGRIVFCEIWYSDDNGKTWTKSETDSWEIPGNEESIYFGECKVLETAEGKLRIYNSWNTYGCIVYSESEDNGKTWGPIVELPELSCARSSMQFVKDIYAENDTTWYMVFVYDTPESKTSGAPRSRLVLCRTEDGINWQYLGDIWRWQSNYASDGAVINHVVDPFIQVTEDYVICGSGFSEKINDGSGPAVHQAQRQHIYSILKETLTTSETFPTTR